MTTFIKLTEGKDGIYVNPALITAMQRGSNEEWTKIRTAGQDSWIWVKETPEEIIKLVSKAKA